RSGQRLVAGEAARACQNGANLRQAAHRRERLRTLTAAAAPARPDSSQAGSSLRSPRRARGRGPVERAGDGGGTRAPSRRAGREADSVRVRRWRTLTGETPSSAALRHVTCLLGNAIMEIGP